MSLQSEISTKQMELIKKSVSRISKHIAKTSNLNNIVINVKNEQIEWERANQIVNIKVNNCEIDDKLIEILLAMLKMQTDVFTNVRKRVEFEFASIIGNLEKLIACQEGFTEEIKEKEKIIEESQVTINKKESDINNIKEKLGDIKELVLHEEQHSVIIIINKILGITDEEEIKPEQKQIVGGKKTR